MSSPSRAVSASGEEEDKDVGVHPTDSYESLVRPTQPTIDTHMYTV